MRREVEFSGERLRKEIFAEGKAIGMPEGAVEVVAKKTVAYVEKWIRGRGVVTRSDIDRVVAKKLRELNWFSQLIPNTSPTKPVFLLNCS